MQAPRKSPAAAASLPHFPQTGRARTFKRYTGIRTLLCACGSCLIRDRWIPCPVVLGGSGREECWCRNSHADRMHSNPLMPLQHGHNGFPCRCTSGGSLAGVHWAGKWYVLFPTPHQSLKQPLIVTTTFLDPATSQDDKTHYPAARQVGKYV